MKEIFRDIIGYEGYYQVSNLGNFISLKIGRRKKPGKKILKQFKFSQKGRSDYYTINLHKEAKQKTFYAHRLIAQTFLGLNIGDSKMFVCHKDDNGLNNNITNLFLGTHQENMKDMVSKGRQQRVKGRTHNNVEVNQYTKEGEFIKTWDSIKNIERSLGFMNISKCCRGKRYKSVGGFKWEYTHA